MNEILKKRIEEAAVEHAESIPQSDERKEYSREDFIAGALFALSHQWIRMNESYPDDDEICLFIDNHGKMQLLTMDDVRKQHEMWKAMIMGAPRYLFEESICLLDKIIAWMPIPKFEPDKTE